jgi:mRNA interferase YafQ
MREIVYSKEYKKDIKKARRQGRDETELDEVIYKLANDIPLPISKKDHELKGKFKGIRECHVSPDWLLLYNKENGALNILNLLRLTSHSEIF